MPQKTKNGFTLVEIMIVLVLIGLLVAMAIPAFTRVREASQNSQLANDMRIFADMLDTFMLDTGTVPVNSTPGTAHTEFATYIKLDRWEATTPIGGQWDVETGGSNFEIAIGVVGYSATNDQLLDFDRAYDDGNLATGIYIQDGGNYYRVIE